MVKYIYLVETCASVRLHKVEIIPSSNPINTRDMVKYVFKSICSRVCRALLEVPGSTHASRFNQDNFEIEFITYRRKIN